VLEDALCGDAPSRNQGSAGSQYQLGAGLCGTFTPTQGLHQQKVDIDSTGDVGMQ